MNRIHLSKALTAEQLKSRMQDSKNILEFKRWQAMYLIQKFNCTTQEVADILAVSKYTVSKWIYNYNHIGESGLCSHARGGRRTAILTWEEEEKLLSDLQNQAEKGLVVIIKDIKQKLERQLNRKLSKDYTYDLLHRHGWRKISPRPKHPKQNKETQEEFKKNSRICWMPPK
jgi:transposase